MKREGTLITFKASGSISAAADNTAMDAYGYTSLQVLGQVTAVAGTGVGIQLFAEGSMDGTNYGQLKDQFGTAASTAMLTASHATSTGALFQLLGLPRYVRVRAGMQSAGAGSYCTFNVYGWANEEAV